MPSIVHHLKRLPLTCALPALFVTLAASPAAHADTTSYADSLNPLGFFSLQSNNQPSSVNGYTTTYMNGATTVPAGGGPESNAASLNGVNNSTPQYIGTSLSGGINGAGSISAYVNLAAPVTGIFYIAGESQSGNDFDLQFVDAGGGEANLCFYSGGGSYTCGTIADSALVNNWNMVTATYNSTNGEQDVYLDGSLLATTNNGSAGQKIDQFTIGYSTTFGGRDFNGLLNDVGVWNYQLSADQVAGLYAAATATPPPPPPPSATPEPSSLALLGTSILGAAGALRRRLRTAR